MRAARGADVRRRVSYKHASMFAGSLAPCHRYGRALRLLSTQQTRPAPCLHVVSVTVVGDSRSNAGSTPETTHSFHRPRTEGTLCHAATRSRALALDLTDVRRRRAMPCLDWSVSRNDQAHFLGEGAPANAQPIGARRSNDSGHRQLRRKRPGFRGTDRSGG